MFPKNLSFLSSLSSPQVRRLLIRFPVREFSSPSSSYPKAHCKQFKQENVRVSVWWNFDTCGVPSGFFVWKTASSIIGAVRANGIKGPINLRVYGDVSQFSEFQLMENISICSVTPGGNTHRELLNDLLIWCFKNPPPIHLFLISGDGDLSNRSTLSSLHSLRMRNYNILVACPGAASEPICSAATILWPWSSILKGGDLNGKYFNYPPDGPFGPWYGGSKMPLENPLSVIEDVTP